MEVVVFFASTEHQLSSELPSSMEPQQFSGEMYILALCLIDVELDPVAAQFLKKERTVYVTFALCMQVLIRLQAF